MWWTGGLMFLLLFLPVEKDQAEGRSAKDLDAFVLAKQSPKKGSGLS
jgi:hypothetical protein